MVPVRRLSRTWRWEDGSLDHCTILDSPDGWKVQGNHDNLHYWLDADPSHACVWLKVQNLADSKGHELTLRRTDAGWFLNTKDHVPHSQDAVFLDLGWSALTNSFPIRSLCASGKDHGEFDVVMVDEKTLLPKVVRQSYTRHGAHWLYKNKDSGFSASLAVDNDSLVTNYPGVCQQQEIAR